MTPAHDLNDFLCGRRHGLPEITVLTEDGKMAENAGKYAGMMRFDARVALLADLKTMGLHLGEADNKMRLGKCSRTGDIIEPMLKPCAVRYNTVTIPLQYRYNTVTIPLREPF